MCICHPQFCFFQQIMMTELSIEIFTFLSQIQMQVFFGWWDVLNLYIQILQLKWHRHIGTTPCINKHYKKYNIIIRFSCLIHLYLGPMNWIYRYAYIISILFGIWMLKFPKIYDHDTILWGAVHCMVILFYLSLVLLSPECHN